MFYRNVYLNAIGQLLFPFPVVLEVPYKVLAVEIGPLVGALVGLFKGTVATGALQGSLLHQAEIELVRLLQRFPVAIQAQLD